MTLAFIVQDTRFVARSEGLICGRTQKRGWRVDMALMPMASKVYAAPDLLIANSVHRWRGGNDKVFQGCLGWDNFFAPITVKYAADHGSIWRIPQNVKPIAEFWMNPGFEKNGRNLQTTHYISGCGH